MAYNFPSSPTPGQLYPSPALNGKTQYSWNSTLGVWEIVQSTIKTNNQNAINNYVWPSNPSTAGSQLTIGSDGVLSWSPAAIPVVKTLTLLETFNGSRVSFTLADPETSNPFSPEPSSNLIVFLGGVPQIVNAAYTVTNEEIIFTEAPASGTVFSAFTLINEL